MPTVFLFPSWVPRQPASDHHIYLTCALTPARALSASRLPTESASPTSRTMLVAHSPPTQWAQGPQDVPNNRARWTDASPMLAPGWLDATSMHDSMSSIRPIPIFLDLMDEVRHYWAHPFMNRVTTQGSCAVHGHSASGRDRTIESSPHQRYGGLKPPPRHGRVRLLFPFGPAAPWPC